MELIIVYSIVIFIVLILSLYVYLIFERLNDKRKSKLSHKSEFEISTLLDKIISKIDQNEINKDDIELLKSFLKSDLTAQILTEKFIHYIDSFKGTFLEQTVKLSEEIGIVDYHINKLSTRDKNARIVAIKNLGGLRNKKALDHILQMLNTSNPEQIYTSLKAISNIGDEEYFIRAFQMIDESTSLSERSLIEIADGFQGDKTRVYLELMNSQNDFISTVFIKSAGNFKNTILLDEIYKFIDDPNNEKKIAAVRAFGNIGDNRYIDDIIKHAKSDSWELRATVAKVLGQLNDAKAIEALLELVRDENFFVRRNSSDSIISLESGLEAVKKVLLGDDKFAIDSIIDSIERKFTWDELVEYDKKHDEPKLTDLITKYINQQ
ncbi:HEAT repeat domain-containing protein [Soehngenia saccharolytica]|nr:HEAT repeat domain-containing protein [Soehngenia saccharolytica]